jgi:hypothetical protein
MIVSSYSSQVYSAAVSVNEFDLRPFDYTLKVSFSGHDSILPFFRPIIEKDFSIKQTNIDSSACQGIRITDSGNIS